MRSLYEGGRWRSVKTGHSFIHRFHQKFKKCFKLFYFSDQQLIKITEGLLFFDNSILIIRKVGELFQHDYSSGYILKIVIQLKKNSKSLIHQAVRVSGLKKLVHL